MDKKTLLKKIKIKIFKFNNFFIYFYIHLSNIIKNNK
jgi:hypothetical protein